MFCEVRSALIDAYAAATNAQASAVQGLSEIAARNQPAAFRDALANAEQARTSAARARLELHKHVEAHGC